MAKSTPRHSSEKIAAYIETIRRFRKVGSESLEQRRGRAPYSDGTARTEAKEAGYSPSIFRAARRFADPASGYSDKDLRDLSAEFKKCGYSFGVAHIVVLLGVPKKRRAKFQHLAIRDGWGKLQLRLEVAKQFGPRRAGGRPRKVPKERLALIAQVEAMCESWRRWDAALHRVPDGGGDAPASALPDELRRAVGKVAKSVAALRNLAEAELARESPGRQRRDIPPDGVPARRPRRSKASSRPG